MDLLNVDVKVKNEDQVLLLLCLLPESYENFVDTMLYGWTSITLQDVTASLNSRELKNKVKDIRAYKSEGEGLIAKERRFEKWGPHSRGKLKGKKLIAATVTKKVISKNTIPEEQ